jgi:hypothetical protein
MRRCLGFVAFAIFLLSCAGSRQSTAVTVGSTHPQWLLDLAKQNVGLNPVIESNKTGSFFLCWQDRETENSVPSLQYVIVRTSDHRVVEQGSVTMGEVKWTGEYEVEISHKQGQVELARSANSTTRVIDLKKYL